MLKHYLFLKFSIRVLAICKTCAILKTCVGSKPSNWTSFQELCTFESNITHVQFPNFLGMETQVSIKLLSPLSGRIP